MTITAPSGGAVTLAQGATSQISATVGPTGAPQAVTYSSATPAVATVSGSGLITAGTTPGTAVITVSPTTGSGSATVTVTVSPKVKTFSISGGDVTGTAPNQTVANATLKEGATGTASIVIAVATDAGASMPANNTFSLGGTDAAKFTLAVTGTTTRTGAIQIASGTTAGTYNVTLVNSTSGTTALAFKVTVAAA